MVEKKEILNPFLYVSKYLDFVLIYVPYKHRFFRFSNEEIKNLKKLNKEFLIKNRIFVEKDYKEKFVKNYREIIKKIKPELNLMYILLTDSCNFRCPYCFIQNNYKDKKRNFLNLKTAEKAIDYFFKNSKSKEKKIIFYGGEPLLNEKVLIHSIKKIRKYSKVVYIGINTNGSIYNKKLSSILKKNNVIVSISLDGFEKINDKTRLDKIYKGSSKRIIQNIDKYIKDGVNVSLSITINKYNIDYLPAISKWVFIRFPKIKSVGFNLPLQNLKGNNLFVDSEYCAFQLYNSYRILRNKGIYEDRVLRRLKYIVEEKPYLKDCGACGNQIVIHPKGLVGPCHGFAGSMNYFNSNLNNLDFYKDKVFKKWNLLSPINKKECIKRNCPFILICGNSCPYYSKITTNSLNKPDNRMYPFLSILIQEIGKDLFLRFPKAIVVDYDGTIISRNSSYEVINFIAKKYGYKKEIPKQNFYDIKKIFTQISKELNIQNKINDMIYLYLKIWKENSTLNLPLIKQLKEIKKKYNLPIFILSRNKKEEIIKELKKFNILGLFEDVFESKKYKKPSLNYFKEFFKEKKLKAEEVVYIGDNYFSDIKKIYSLGIREAISFRANPSFYNEIDNGWLLDIFEDYKKLDDGKSKYI